MITYLYWTSVILLTLLALIGLGGHLGKWKAGTIVAGVILLGGVGSYYFHFQQIFVKRWGGVMTIPVATRRLRLDLCVAKPRCRGTTASVPRLELGANSLAWLGPGFFRNLLAGLSGWPARKANRR